MVGQRQIRGEKKMSAALLKSNLSLSCDLLIKDETALLFFFPPLKWEHFLCIEAYLIFVNQLVILDESSFFLK